MDREISQKEINKRKGKTGFYIGLTSFDFVEITEGVQKGETVIISDLTKYKNVNEIEIK